MKSIILATSLTLAASANVFASNESTSNIRYVGDVEFASYCAAVVEDNVSMLKKAISSQVGSVAMNRRGVLRKVVAAEGVSCNGISLIEFSEQYKASEVNTFLTTSL